MYKIGEFSKITNIPISTLRYYDEIGVLKPDKINEESNYRYYTDVQVEEVKLINYLKSIGFSLNEISNNLNKFNKRLILEKKNILLNNKLLIEEKLKKLDNLQKEGNELGKEKITDLISNDEIRILYGTYDQLLYKHGMKMADTYYGESVKEKKANYYLVYKGEKVLDDFAVYNEDNCLVIDNLYFGIFYDKSIMNKIFDKVKE